MSAALAIVRMGPLSLMFAGCLPQLRFSARSSLLANNAAEAAGQRVTKPKISALSALIFPPFRSRRFPAADPVPARLRRSFLSAAWKAGVMYGSSCLTLMRFLRQISSMACATAASVAAMPSALRNLVDHGAAPQVFQRHGPLLLAQRFITLLHKLTVQFGVQALARQLVFKVFHHGVERTIHALPRSG